MGHAGGGTADPLLSLFRKLKEEGRAFECQSGRGPMCRPRRARPMTGGALLLLFLSGLVVAERCQKLAHVNLNAIDGVERRLGEPLV